MMKMIRSRSLVLCSGFITLLVISAIVYFNSNSQQKQIVKEYHDKKNIISSVSLNYSTDSIDCIINIINNSKRIVYYPNLRYIVNDLFPVPVYCQHRFENGNIINIIPSNSNADEATIDLIIEQDNYIPYYYAINPNQSLEIKFSFPNEYYKDKYLDYFNNRGVISNFKIEINIFLTFNEMLSSKNRESKLQSTLEYDSFYKSPENLCEIIFFKTTEEIAKRSYYELFNQNSFVIRCDTVFNCGDILK